MRNMHCGMKLILAFDIDFFSRSQQLMTLQIMTQIMLSLHWIQKKMMMATMMMATMTMRLQDDDFEDHEHDLNDDVGGLIDVMHDHATCSIIFTCIVPDV